MMTFNEADKVVHKVEDQWHYKSMVAFGYEPMTKEAAGFVRSYTYKHPETFRQFEITTGANADYWTDKAIGKVGYWSDLEPYLARINQGAL